LEGFRSGELSQDDLEPVKLTGKREASEAAYGTG
jgi:hypothetical protein